LELCIGENLNRILVIAAHPDDEVLGCGATIAKHIHNGDIVQIIFLADGFSSRNDDSNRDNLAVDASKILGCEQPIFFHFPDNQLDTVILLDLVIKIEDAILKFKPNIVYTHHYGDLNIDHQIVHKAAITACRPQPSFCVKEIYSFEILSSSHWQSQSMTNVFSPNYFIDVSDFVGKKLDALRCYDSEIRIYPHARSYEAVENLAKFRGSTIGVNAAEAFCVERLIK
jgi:LmbE family N-acetylglucosaminyl deacetylase